MNLDDTAPANDGLTICFSIERDEGRGRVACNLKISMMLGLGWWWWWCLVGVFVVLVAWG